MKGVRQSIGSWLARLALVTSMLACTSVLADDVDSTAQPAITTDTAALESFVDGLAAAHLQSSGVPGMTVAIVGDGRTLLLKGYGWADIEQRRPVDANSTLFRIGSITKLFTYTALMQLAEQGRIDLDRDINDYLGNVRIATAFDAPITATHLLAHRAGFESGDLGYDFFGDARKVPSLRDFIATHQLRRVRPPGEATAYSNYGASVLGLAVQQVSGEAYADYVERHIFAPLGMTHSSLLEPLQQGRGERADHMPEGLAAQAAIGYYRSAGRNRPLPYEHIAPGASPAGAMFSSAADMARFMNAWLGGGEPILRTDTVRRMWTRTYSDRAGTTDFAHGFFNGNTRGHESFGHTGAMLGFKSSLQLLPEPGLGVFVAVNSEQGWAVATGMAQQILSRLVPSSVAGGESAHVESDLGRYAGRFLTTRRSYTKLEKLLKLETGQATVSPTADGQLVIARAGDVRTWTAVAPLTFRDVEGTDLIRFQADAAGSIVRFYVPAGHENYERVGWLQSPAAFYLAAALAALLSITTLLTPLAAGQSAVGVRVSWLRGVAAGLTLVVLVLFHLGIANVRAQGWMIQFTWPGAELLRATLVGKLLALTALAALISLWPAWRRSAWTLSRRLHYTALIAALGGLLLSLWQWNFFASPYN